MSSISEAMGQAPSAATASSATGVRPFFWSVRRELWEHRSIYLVPAAVGVVVIVSVLIAALRPSRTHWTPTLVRTGGGGGEYLYAPTVAGAMHVPLLIPLLIGAASITLVGGLTGVFYCLGALNGERRDRSILFWKSLPVSNVTTVASKVFAAMVILPVSVLAAIVVTHLAALAILVTALVVQGQGLDSLRDLPLLRGWLMMAWSVFAFWLWWAPLYGWALLVSACAKRLTLLWAVLPPIALAVFERVAFNTEYVTTIIRDRLDGLFVLSLGTPAPARLAIAGDLRLPHFDLPGFFAHSPLWIGLVFAALCFAGAVWLRRRAEPV